MAKYRSDIFEACYEIIKDGYESGRISEAEWTEFADDCFIPDLPEAPRVPVLAADVSRRPAPIAAHSAK
jgi:hypothetical protein